MKQFGWLKQNKEERSKVMREAEKAEVIALNDKENNATQ